MDIVDIDGVCFSLPSHCSLGRTFSFSGQRQVEAIELRQVDMNAIVDVHRDPTRNRSRTYQDDRISLDCNQGFLTRTKSTCTDNEWSHVPVGYLDRRSNHSEGIELIRWFPRDTVAGFLRSWTTVSASSVRSREEKQRRSRLTKRISITYRSISSIVRHRKKIDCLKNRVA